MTRNKDTEYNNDHYNNNNNSNNYNKFERKISRLFDDFLNDVGFTRTHSSKFRGGVDDKHSTWSPAIDIKEVDREYLVIADVPGVRKEDIDIELHESVLVLSGHLNQDIYSSPQAQEINIGKDNRQHLPQQPNQYPPPQQYQQQPPPQPYQQTTEPQPFQQTTEPQKYQQTTEPQKYQQQPSAAQQYQQTVEQKYNLSNEPQQQSNLPQQYQQMPNDPHQHQQQSNDPHYQQQSNEFHHIKNRRQHEPFRGDRFHIQERPYGHFSRSIQLPTNIKSDDEFYATLENGVLKIRIPKNNDKPKRKITIK
jgi:HSP20 family molecular chaperone IbpA